MLSDVLQSFGITNYCNAPTRVFTSERGTTVSSIDYMTTNICQSRITCNISEPYISDHRLLELYIAINIQKEKPLKTYRTIRILKDKNINDLKAKLEAEDWEGIHATDVDSAFNSFMETVLWHYNMTCPRKTIKNETKTLKSTWMTEKLLYHRREIKNLYDLMRQTDSLALKNLYKTQRKAYRKSITETKQNHYKNIIETSTNPSKVVWNIINSQLGKPKENHIRGIKVNEEIMMEKQKIAGAFGQYFSTIATRTVQTHFGNNISSAPTMCQNVNSTIFLYPTTSNEIERTIMSLESKKSTGFDEIPATVLKRVCGELKEPLTEIFNTSLNTGKFPSVLKLAITVPIFKKGDKQSVENYRPISLLSCFSKILERVIYNRLQTFLDKNNTIGLEQHGFRTGKSTETACFNLTHFIFGELERDRIVLGLFFDLSRAFDTLNLNFISQKLDRVGIRGTANLLIMSFLEERKFLVKIEDQLSNEFHLNIGAAQGSVLAPLLFLIYKRSTDTRHDHKIR